MKEKLFNFFDHAEFVSICLLLFYIPISNALIEIFAGFVIFFFLLKNIMKPDLNSLKTREFFVIMLFFIFSAISVVNSGEFLKKSLITLFFKWLENILVFVAVCLALSKSRKKIMICLGVFLFSAFLINIDGIFQKITQNDFMRNRPLIQLFKGNKSYAITASFQHYNDLGAYLVFILSLAIMAFISLKRVVLRTAVFVLIIMSLACLLLTYSRGSWIGFFIASVLMMYFSKEYSKILPLLLVFCFFLFLPFFKDRSFLMFKYMGVAGRFHYWYPAWRMVIENPFLGKGIGTFMDYFAKYQPSINVSYAHNCYLQIWAEVGIFGLLSFLWFIFLVVTRGVKAYLLNKDGLLLGLVCGFCGFLFLILFDTHLYSLQLSVFFWFITGVIVALTNNAIRPKDN